MEDRHGGRDATVRTLSEEVPCVCSVVHVRTCLRCCATLRATAPCIHMPTQGHSATGYTRARDSVRVVSRSVHCRACVHCALSAGVCMWSVGTLFRARGIDATVGVQRSASTAPVPKGTPPRCLAHTPHAPALVPPVVDHLPCRGGVSLRSRSACAAQQGRPTPSSPEEKERVCEGRKTLLGGPTDSVPKTLVPNLTAPPAVRTGKQHAPSGSDKAQVHEICRFDSCQPQETGSHQ